MIIDHFKLQRRLTDFIEWIQATTLPHSSMECTTDHDEPWTCDMFTLEVLNALYAEWPHPYPLTTAGKERYSMMKEYADHKWATLNKLAELSGLSDNFISL